MSEVFSKSKIMAELEQLGISIPYHKSKSSNNLYFLRKNLDLKNPFEYLKFNSTKFKRSSISTNCSLMNVSIDNESNDNHSRRHSKNENYQCITIGQSVVDERFYDYYLNFSENTEENHVNYVYNCLKSSFYLPLVLDSEEIQKKSINIPPTNKRKTIFLDLDETLIHSDTLNQYPEKIKIEMQNQIINLILRPNLDYFLSELSKHFELVLFTASSKEYADEILKIIDPQQKYFNFSIYRESAFQVVEGLYVKDLRIIENRDLKNCVLVDNNILSFANQLDNGVLIPSFYYNENDIFLNCLLNYFLSEILDSQDVRMVNQDAFSFEKMKEEVRLI